MRTPWIWSVSLGRWWNLHVRLHMFFFLFVAFAIYLTSNTYFEPNWLGSAFAVVLFVSVLLHEIGHVVVARRLGGVADEIVIGPLGGLNPVRVLYEPHSELVALMAGALINALVCLICGIWLAVLSPELTDLVGLLQPTASFRQPGEPQSIITVLKLVFWVNWSLIVVNLIPCFPFDGGRALNALTAFLWPELGPSQAFAAICRLGKVVALFLLVVAWIQFKPTAMDDPQPPAWLTLTLLSIYIFFNSRREELQQSETEQEEETVFGYDFSQGYTSLERSLVEEDEQPPVKAPQQSVFGRWLERRRETQRERERAQEVEDERRVDEVLDRLHKHGMRSLSAEDRTLLERVSQRYRGRQNSN